MIFTRSALVLGLTAIVLNSCIEHEVIPPPSSMVDLSSNFYGEIDGTQVVLTENVLGYTNNANKAKNILPPPDASMARYFSEMSSTESMMKIKVGLGSLDLDASLLSDPSLNAFNEFFTSTNLPAYSNDALTGFEVTFTDAFGTEWKSDENRMISFMDAEFTEITQESDSDGDYSQFICNFKCYAYNFDFSDSVKIENGVYQGWFKR